MPCHLPPEQRLTKERAAVDRFVDGVISAVKVEGPAIRAGLRTRCEREPVSSLAHVAATRQVVFEQIKMLSEAPARSGRPPDFGRRGIKP